MLEPKDAKQLNDEEVLAKKTSAVTWCNQATAHAVGYAGKGWTYVLIPHNAITDNMTVTGLAAAFAVES
jgi:type III restriction enzyme